MTSDYPPVAENGNFDLVQPRGFVARVTAYVGGTIMMVAVPALFVALGLSGELDLTGEALLASVVGGGLGAIVAGGMGLVIVMSTVRGKRRADRLARNGRQATALVVGSADRALHDEPITELTLRISGPEVPEFQTVYRSSRNDVPVLGAQFAVVVDPTDNVYRILR